MHLIMHLIQYGDSIIDSSYHPSSISRRVLIRRRLLFDSSEQALEHSEAVFCSDMNQGDLKCDEINSENQAVRRDP
jgi:hypothetical protein